MKQKTLLVVSTHSFVDLITNSSTELFVCDSKKTVDAIKELLTTLLNNHDSIMGTKHTFEGVYGNIKVSPYKFEWWDVPQELRDRYDSLHRYCAFGRNPYEPYRSDDERNAEENALEEQERDIMRKHNTHEAGLYERDKDEYERRWAAARKEEDELWTPFGAKVAQVEADLFLDFLRQNDFTAEQIAAAKVVCDESVKAHIEEKRGKYPHGYRTQFPTKELEDAHEAYYEYSSWGITCKKGDVFVYSADDNSIPYEMFGTIESYLNADRYHLG